MIIARWLAYTGFTFVLSLLFAASAWAAAGDADATFGGAGYVRYAAPRSLPVLFSATLALDDGSVIAAGAVGAEIVVQHYRADGTLDETFGIKGTAFVPDLVAVNRVPPALQLIRDAGGGILVEQNGTVRRLSSSGIPDANYRPAAMNVKSGPFTLAYRLLPQADGHFVVVTGQNADVETSQISVRFFNSDGTPDTTRGPFGERLLYPGGQGSYTKFPLSAVTDANGRILIAARWDRSANDVSLVLIRLNADGSYDTSFGQGGVALIGSNLGNVSLPQVTVGRDGRIAYLFGALADPTPDPYFVVYVLTANGQIDTSAPSGGRIAVLVPASERLNFDTLGFVSGPPDLTVIGTSTALLPTFLTENRLMVWHANIANGTIGSPLFTTRGLSSDFRLGGRAGGPQPGGFSASGNRLWIAEDEGWYTFASLGGSFSIQGARRGVLNGYDIDPFGARDPIQIAPTFAGHAEESFFAVTELADRKLLALGFAVGEQQRLGIPTLTRFTADGRIDPAFGAGSGRIELGVGDGLRGIFLPSPGDSPTVFRAGYDRCGSLGCSYGASIVRLDSGGNPVATFGSAGTLTLAAASLASSDTTMYGPGFVDEQRTVTVLQMNPQASSSAPPLTITPLRIDSQGTSTLATSQTLSGLPGTPSGRIDRLPDGRWQAIVVSNGASTLRVARWLATGAVDPGMPSPITVTAANIGTGSIDARVLSDGRTVLATDTAVLRLKADGTLDPSFGNSGTVTIPYASFEFGVGYSALVPTSKLAVDAAGRILFGYSWNTATGSTIAIARLTPDGQPDTTFTNDGRYDSVFSLNSAEQFGGLLATADGGIVAAGQSDAFALLLRLKDMATAGVGPGMTVVEFYNTHLDHYFMSAGPSEIVGIDKGLAGPGWQRTGYGFRAWPDTTTAPASASPVCRFYGTVGRGPNSHFYTVSSTECAIVKQDPGWTYEGIAFYLFPPASNAALCGPGQQPVYRVYNNRFSQNDSNHRYATDPAVYVQMQTVGWLPESIVFCAPTQ